MQGQITGGVMQQLGGTIYENLAYDDDGVPRQRTLKEYGMPTVWSAPEIEIEHLVSESPCTRIGAKGGGGSREGTIGALGGGFLGAIGGTFAMPIPVIGTLAGVLLGTFLGAVAGELRAAPDKRPEETIRPALAATLGRVLGLFAKTGVALLIWGGLLAAAVWG